MKLGTTKVRAYMHQCWCRWSRDGPKIFLGVDPRSWEMGASATNAAGSLTQVPSLHTIDSTDHCFFMTGSKVEKNTAHFVGSLWRLNKGQFIQSHEPECSICCNGLVASGACISQPPQKAADFQSGLLSGAIAWISSVYNI